MNANTNTNRTALEVWGMPVLLTVMSVVALVVGLIADGVADIVACIGAGAPVVVAAWHVSRAVMRTR
ncbi:MAG TPA: hypothetical protein VM580_26285 [Labilithrix sp.]|nr:hypothetical protein [Labilithrix sp.]